MSDAADEVDEVQEPIAAILAPGRKHAFSRGKEKLEALRDRCEEVLSEVCVAVPGDSPITRKKIPEGTTVVDDQVPGKNGPLVGFYSLLHVLERPVLVLRSDRPPPPTNVLKALLKAWLEEDEPTGVYVVEPAEKIPFPVILHPRVEGKVRHQIQQGDPRDVDYFLRSIQARKVTP